MKAVFTLFKLNFVCDAVIERDVPRKLSASLERRFFRNDVPTLQCASQQCLRRTYMIESKLGHVRLSLGKNNLPGVSNFLKVDYMYHT